MKLKDGNALLALVERKTRYMMTIVQDDHTEESVCYALKQLVKEFGQALFTQVFKSITADNSSGFNSLYDTLKHLSDIHFATPIHLGEEGQTNGIMGCLDDLFQKGPIDKYSR